MKIALATDHAGYEDVKKLQTYLESLGHECVSFGPTAFNQDDDYPDFIFPAAQAVASGECDRGIIFGGSGQGEAMVANRVKGVRCALFYGPVTAKRPINAEGEVSDDPFVLLRLSREHNDSNMLSLAARFLSEPEIESATKAWLDMPGADVERHLRRVKKLDEGA
jgi:ribose 5-phosphate isomerase B